MESKSIVKRTKKQAEKFILVNVRGLKCFRRDCNKKRIFESAVFLVLNPRKRDDSIFFFLLQSLHHHAYEFKSQNKRLDWMTNALTSLKCIFIVGRGNCGAANKLPQ